MGRFPQVGSRRAKVRGFTLTELLVAVIAGLLVAAAAISFSKQSTEFFSQEARIAASQVSVLAGFQRLQADVSRAAYLSTPNITRDIQVGKACAPNYSNWPPALQQLAGLHVTIDGSTGAAQLPDGHRPDLLRISGSITSIELFRVQAIEPSGAGHTVHLVANSGSIARSGLTPGDTAGLQTIFAPGRILRIVNLQGLQLFEIIEDAAWPMGQSPQVRTQGPLPMADTDGCGVKGFGTEMDVSVVNIIEYGIANVKDHPVYQKTIYSEAGTALGDANRTELVRREILLDGNDPPALEDDPNVEIVAEYAVDLRVGLWASNRGVAGLTYIPPSTPAITTKVAIAASYNAGDHPSGPASIRSVELRLAVRSREMDRKVNTDQSDPLMDGGFMFRYPMPNGRFSRVRTLLADVVLHNQRDEAW